MNELFIGIDLHKNQFTTYVLHENREGQYFIFKTTEQGYIDFIKLLNLCYEKGFKVNIVLFKKLLSTKNIPSLKLFGRIL